MPGRARRWPLVVAILWLCAASSPALSGDLRIEPISLTLRPDASSTYLWLDNTGHQVLGARVRIFSWTQDQGGEALAPARELDVSPHMLRIAPRGRQMVRVVRLVAGDASRERAYRLIVDEPAGDGTRGAAPRLLYSIPVFASPLVPGPAPPLETRIETTATDGGSLRLYNHGGRHARVSSLAFVGTDGRRHLLAPGLAGYVLPRRYKSWPLPGNPGTWADGHFEAEVDGQPAILIPAPGLPTDR